MFLLNFFDSQDQNIGFFELLKEFFVVYSKRYEDFEWINLWYGLENMELYNNVVWITITLFFPQLTLLIPKFLFNKFKEYAEYQEVAVTGRVQVTVDNTGVSAREANIYNTIRPYLYKTVIAIICSVAIFVPIAYAIIKYVSVIYSMIIVLVLDIIILVLACKKRKTK